LDACTYYGNRFIFVKSLDWKSPGSYQVQNYWPKGFPDDQTHITKKFNVLMEKLEKVSTG